MNMFWKKKKPTGKLLVVGPSTKMDTVKSAIEGLPIFLIIDLSVDRPYLLDTGIELEKAK